jgi:outer membrane protein OmpA-like peptidoglycan-associated protein
VGALLSLILVPVFETPASAQVIVGNGAKPEVVIDSSVLDRLGNEPTLSDLFLGGKGPTSKPLIGEKPSNGRTTGFHAPRQIVLKKPFHKAPKAKVIAVAAKTAAAPQPQVVAVAPTVPPPPAEAKSDSKPVEVTPPVAEQSLPAVNLPVIAPQETHPAAKGNAKLESNPQNKPATVVDGKSEPQAVPPPPSKPAAIQSPLPDKVAVSPAAVPADTVTTAPPATTAPLSSPTAPSTEPVAPPAAITVLPTPSPKEQQVAHLPPSAPTPPSSPISTSNGSVEAPLTILFEKDGARLPDEVRTSLTQLADRLSSDTTSQIQLLAYADGDEDNASKARRLSLSRALAVRSFLIDQGVRSTRIEVRALGNKVPEGPADRVDILLQKR